MGIYLGDNQGIAYKGEYKPVNIYHGSKKAVGWELSEKTGTELSWDDTYNDKVLSAVVEGSTEQVQTVQGKNLFDNERVTTGLMFDNDGSIVPYATYCYSNYIQITPLTSYRFSGFTGKLTACRYDQNKVFISSSPSYSGQLAFGSGENGNYVRFSIRIESLPTTQLELGSTATTYEPFVPNSPSPEYPSPITSVGGIDFVSAGNSGQSYTAHRDIILRSLPDGTKDTYDAVTGQITRRVGFKVFDESIVWLNVYARVNDESCYFYTSYFDSDIYTQDNNTIAPGYCTHAPIASLNTVFSTATTYDCICLTSTQSYKVRFRIRREHLPEPTKDGFLHFLAAQHAAGTPVAVQYKLSEPTIEQIDPLPLPTYPRYTTLNCSEQMTARVRVVEK